MIPIPVQALLLIATTLYQALGCWRADQSPPPGQRFDVGGHRLHLHTAGSYKSGQPTIVLDHSLGGIEGYLLIEALSQLTRTCIYDRAGYGWSDRSRAPRTSRAIVAELDALLTQAAIEPPYLLIGDSFGSYNVRLYAHQFPQKVAGIVLTDGLHERTMLQLPWSLKA
ncbi:MAG: alpha/beta fold hydrolase [Leptolyngbyaceae cyanobacterium]